MANVFQVVPQTVQVGPVANGVTITFYYDFVDHSICKMLVTASGGTLAAQTLVPFTRNGLAGTQTTTIPALDTGSALPLELSSGDVADSTVAHSAGFGV